MFLSRTYNGFKRDLQWSQKRPADRHSFVVCVGCLCLLIALAVCVTPPPPPPPPRAALLLILRGRHSVLLLEQFSPPLHCVGLQQRLGRMRRRVRSLSLSVSLSNKLSLSLSQSTSSVAPLLPPPLPALAAKAIKFTRYSLVSPDNRSFTHWKAV